MYHISRGEADIPHGGGRIDMVFHSCVYYNNMRVIPNYGCMLHRLNSSTD